MEPANQQLNTVNQNDEITLKDLITSFYNWVGYLRKRWLLLLLFAIIGASGGFAIAYMSKPSYIGTLSFVLEEKQSGGMGAYAGIASQFGIDLGGSEGGGLYSEDNIIEFLKSRLIIQKVLLMPQVINNKNITLAEYYLDVFEYKKRWKNPALQQLHYPVNSKALFTRLQDSVLNLIYLNIIQKNLSVAKRDKKISFIDVGVMSTDEKFSEIFPTLLMKEASDFYISTKTKRTNLIVERLQDKADSLENLLNRKTYSVAQTQDINLNPARRVATVGAEVATRDKMVLQTMYAEVVKNLEVSRMSMAQETPLVQIIDKPILPLEKTKKGKLKFMVGGFFLGLIISSIVLILRRIYRSIMQ